VKRIAVITGESVWLVTTDDDGLSGNVEARASFGFHMPNEHNYFGPILTGPDGLNLREGTRLVFRCQCAASHVGWGGDGIVTSGAIVRVINTQDVPVPEPENLYDAAGNQVGQSIVFNPSWNWLAPFVGSAQAMADFRQCFEVADLLVTLKDMGRVTDADIVAASKRLRG
jgi:hypothetical protein